LAISACCRWRRPTTGRSDRSKVNMAHSVLS
jgi:hypothetical protein